MSEAGDTLRERVGKYMDEPLVKALSAEAATPLVNAEGFIMLGERLDKIIELLELIRAEQ